MKNVIEYLQSSETKERIIALISENILLYQRIDTEDKIEKYTGLIYNHFVKECVQSNQYISLSNETISVINEIYKQLVLILRLLGKGEYQQTDLSRIVDVHRNRLIAAIQRNEYHDKQDQLYIPCAEYTGEFQNRILRTDLLGLTEPIIDVGCGIQCELLKALRKMHYSDVYGLDQYINNDPKIIRGNWFDYTFLKNTWGTVIAHMSFSNHLRRSLINKDKHKEKYISKYYEILLSLKPDGVFIYTPSVRELEDTINRDEYETEYYRNMDDRNLDTVHIKRVL